MLLPALILAGVMLLAMWRPRGLSPAWPALGGAVLCVALGLTSLGAVAHVLSMTWDAAVALVGLMLLSATLEDSGAFRAAAHAIALRARGSGLRLFLGLCLLAAVAAILLANDGAILILTPIVCELCAMLGFGGPATLAFLFAAGFLCDGLSTVLPTSNLTNLLLLDALGLDPGDFILRMLWPSLLTLVAAIGSLTLLFARRVPRHFDAAALGPPPPFAVGSERATWSAFAALMIGYAVAGFVRLPLGPVVLLVAAVLLAWEHRAGTVRARHVLERLPWSIVLFAASIFVVVTALADRGAGALLARAFAERTGRAGTLAVGLEVGALAALANNLPVLLVSVLALAARGLPQGSPLPYAALAGANIGSKLTPMGSLATLLWLELLRRRGLSLTWPRYLALALLPTLATLLATLAGLLWP